jgi:hypothetical protein
MTTQSEEYRDIKAREESQRQVDYYLIWAAYHDQEDLLYKARNEGLTIGEMINYPPMIPQPDYTKMLDKDKRRLSLLWKKN